MTPQIEYVLGATVLSIALGLLIGFAYARGYRGMLLSASFVHACVVIVPLTALVMHTIRSATAFDNANRAMGEGFAFALIGLLGLIRFRTIVRDTREFTFVFISIVTGVGIGGGQFVLTAGGCVFVLILLIVLERIKFGTPRAPSLRVRATGAEDAFAQYETALRRVAERVNSVSLRHTADGGTTYTFEIVAGVGQDIPSIAVTVRAVPGTSEVNVVRLQRGKGAEGDGD
ncbi:hypothetical protein CVM73_02910 [Bradyrhizobium forestalis]|uniref:DUF4956 domain-containing protein n=1 Tax=Bradyrhizobium forestalis TaxID=1419263 RepID=A0A2M8RFD5_9BRAD|nr:DUF4956 domain-containing protein [Bradyrhizobium forestalis]PJG56525.1 hypothetical protein CVM73_02910 [Bradyrhizobium forestalis]